MCIINDPLSYLWWMAVEVSSWIGACVTQRIPKPLQDWEQVASCRRQTPSQDHYRRWLPEKQTSSQWRRSLHRRIIILKDMNPFTEPAVGDIVVEKLSSNGVTSENKTIYTPRQVGVFVVFYRKLEQRHNIAWREWWRESFISPL